MEVTSTRERILDAAADLFVEKGFAATSLREIAERVGVTKAALYYHFTSKDELLSALLQPLDEFHRLLLARMEGPLDPQAWFEGTMESLDWLLAHHRLFQLIDHNRGALLELEDDEHLALHVELHRRTEELMADTRHPVQDRVQWAMALGSTVALTEFGSALFAEDEAKVRTVVESTVRKILGLV